MTDDQGYGDVGAHGNTMIRTPNLDKLAGESVRLTDFHVDPTCAPTRAALMTGRVLEPHRGLGYPRRPIDWWRATKYDDAEAARRCGLRHRDVRQMALGRQLPLPPRGQRVPARGAARRRGRGTDTPTTGGNNYFDDTYWVNGNPDKV